MANDPNNLLVDDEKNVTPTVDEVTPLDAEAEISAKLDKMMEDTPAETQEGDETPQAKPQAKPAVETPARPQAGATKEHTYGADGSVVGADGKVIAKAGSERRHWERARTMEQRAVAAERQVTESNQRVAQAEQVLHAGRSLGLSADEQLSSLKLFSWYKKEPEKMLKWFLTEAQAAGYNVATIVGGEAAGGVNMDALGKMMDQRLQPFTEQRAEQTRQAQAYHAAEQELNTFYAQYPNAPVHEDQLAQIMQGAEQHHGITLSLREAYLQLSLWAQKQGLDMDRPLEAQVAAKQAGRTLNQARRPAAMPRGRGGQMETVTGQAGSYDEFSRDDIIRAAMRESGIGSR